MLLLYAFGLTCLGIAARHQDVLSCDRIANVHECSTYPPLKAPTGFFAGRAVAIGSCNLLEVANVRRARVGRAVAIARVIIVLDAMFMFLGFVRCSGEEGIGNATNL